MSLSPYFRSPFTDIGGAIITHQWYGPCADLELKAVDCLEAYGLDRGVKKCETILKDFQECSLKIKQFKRMNAMRVERHKQYWTGERKKADRWAPAPPPDSF